MLPAMTDFDDQDFDQERPSKTQRKKQMHELQALGEYLLNLKPDVQQQFPLSDSLQKALEEATRITKREALRRHKQFIGRLMRDEPEIDVIRAKVEAMESATEVNSRLFKQLEMLRENLITGDNSTIGSTIEMYPEIDRQKLRQLVKKAKQERQRIEAGDASLSPANARALFRFLRETQEQHS